MSGLLYIKRPHFCSVFSVPLNILLDPFAQPFASTAVY